MIKSTYVDDYNEAVSCISSGRHLRKVLEEQKKQISSLNDWNLMDECLEIEDAYLLMLKYFSEGIEDDKRNEVYGQLRKRMLMLAQRIKRQRGLKESTDLYYSKLRFVARQSRTVPYYTKKLRAIYSQDLFLDITGTQETDNNEGGEKYIEELFDYIWVASTFSKDEYEELKNMFIVEQFITDNEKQWLTSALMMSALSFYDEKKLELLVALSDYKDHAVACRAIVGLALVATFHRDLVKVSCPHWLSEFGKSMSATWTLLQIFCLTISNTKRIRKQIEQGLMPLFNNIQQSVNPDQLQDILEDDDADLPPGVDADTIKKIRESMQSMSDNANKGLDVYYSSFSKMKNNIFFQEARNWFKPFSLNSFGDNHIVNSICEILQNDVLCDSDKYSLAYMISSVSHTMKGMFEDMFNNMMPAHEGVKSKDAALYRRFNNVVSSLDFSARPNECMVYALSYLQDLYRFYTIKVRNTLDANPFSIYNEERNVADRGSLIVIDNEVVFPHLHQNDMTLVAVEAYNTRLYSAAQELFGLLKRKRALRDVDMLILALSHAKLRDYESAVEYFKTLEKAGASLSPELKMLYCSCLVNSAVHNADTSLEHALKIYSELYEDDVPSFPIYEYSVLLLRLGHVDKAQDVLFKEDFLKPGQIRIERLLLKCLLKQGNLKQALPYCMKITADAKSDNYDYLNAGHLYFALGDIAKAVEYYKMSCKGNSGGAFYLSEDDRELLLSLGVTALSIGLMIDAIS